MNSKKKPFISRTVVISGLLIFIILFIGIVFTATLFTLPQNVSMVFESDVTIIAYSTFTPAIDPQIDNSLSTPTLDPKYIIFARGLKVIVQGTGGEGLRIHQTAGQDSPTIYLANESDLFVIIDGPVITGGYVWWRIKSSRAENILGWVVQDFLQLDISFQ
jgi:hypothetical protein